MTRKILTSLLEQLILDGGSDLHLRSGKQPRIRVDGHLRTLDHPPLQPSLIHDLADIIQGAYSGPNRPLIPIESGHLFRGKPAGDSGAK